MNLNNSFYILMRLKYSNDKKKKNMINYYFFNKIYFEQTKAIKLYSEFLIYLNNETMLLFTID